MSNCKECPSRSFYVSPGEGLVVATPVHAGTGNLSGWSWPERKHRGPCSSSVQPPDLYTGMHSMCVHSFFLVWRQGLMGGWKWNTSSSSAILGFRVTTYAPQKSDELNLLILVSTGNYGMISRVLLWMIPQSTKISLLFFPRLVWQPRCSVFREHPVSVTVLLLIMRKNWFIVKWASQPEACFPTMEAECFYYPW